MARNSVAQRSTLRAVRHAIRAAASVEDAVHLRRFFKTGPGEYGEGDRFLGVRVPALRRLVRTHRSLLLDDALTLLSSVWHEERLFALLILIEHYRAGDPAVRQRIYGAYLANIGFINNWDLVDASAEHIVGAHLTPNDITVLERLSQSEVVWERRIAMLATFHWIKRREFGPALNIARRLVNDNHDLIHKAVGWMLREIGNRDGMVERAFLREQCRTMPRTMLRYAIEKFPEAERRRYLSGDAAVRG